MTHKRNAIVLLSGGIDSTSCAYLLKSQGFSVRGMFIDYGQAASQQEYQAVKTIENYFNIPVEFIKINVDHIFNSGEIKGRNALLISAAILYGSINKGIIAIGVHAGTSYYDCSEGFIERMKKVTEEYTNGLVTLSAPFLTWDKSKVYKYFCEKGLSLNITYSCESGTLPPCGTCASCLDRSKLEC